MKAMVNKVYGSPDVLALTEVDKPVPKAGEVLIKVHASSVNSGDWHLLRADPFLVRLMFGLFKPKVNVLGCDIAGVVEAVGPNTEQFQPGDHVYGDLSECGFGAFAEYVCVPETAAVVAKPENLSFEEAAAVPSAALTALQGVRDYGDLQAGQKVLVNGASGGVGSYAVQIAKALGAEVTAVCNGKKLEMVRSLGADCVIDYTQEDPLEGTEKYDLIIDTAAYRSIFHYKKILNPKGTYILVGGKMKSLFQAMLLGPIVSRKGGIKYKNFLTNPNQKDLLVLKELLEDKKIAPFVDRSYPLRETPDAIRYMEERKVQGKIVITMV